MFEDFPLSLLQQEMWLAELTTDTARENGFGAVRLNGRLDIRALNEAVSAVIRRHATLRTRIVGNPPLQRFDTLDFQLSPEAVADISEVVALAALDASRRIELDRYPLWNMRLLRIGPEDHVLTFVFHHIIIDGWSIQIFFRDLALSYTAAVQGGSALLQPLSYTFRDWCDQERADLVPELESEIDYWRTVLPDAPPAFTLPPGCVNEFRSRNRGGSFGVELDRRAFEPVREYARALRTTPFCVVAAGVAMTMRTYQEDTGPIILGVPVDNRLDLDLHPVVGYVANVVPVVIEVGQHQQRFSGILEAVRAGLVSALSSPLVPPEILMRSIYGLNSLPYNLCLNVQSPGPFDRSMPDLDMSGISFGNGTTNFDFEIFLVQEAERYRGSVAYDVDRVPDDVASKFWLEISENILNGVRE